MGPTGMRESRGFRVSTMNDASEQLQPIPYDDSNWSDDEMSALAVDMFDGLDNPQEIQ